MQDKFTITREIGIDAGHRVMSHGSKCKNLHGHRYKIQATCSAPILIPDGEQQGMILDFGFLKELMMVHIDEPCDHGMIMCSRDPMLKKFFTFEEDYFTATNKMLSSSLGYAACLSQFGKLYIVNFIPTAEQLAKHWFERLSPAVSIRSDGYGTLESITVHETPNCKATYNGK